MSSLSPQERAKVLIEALPYMRQFFGKTVVIKYGGNAMVDEGLKEQVMKDIALLRYVGIKPILVHGGGPEINTLMEKFGCESRFVDGLRITTAEDMDLVEMALAGKTNKNLVALLNSSGGMAIGLSGKDANLLIARKVHHDRVDLGLVGEVIEVNAPFLSMLTEQGYIPVICSVAIGQDAQTYNVNADHVAGAIAVAMNACKLVVLTDVEGLLERVDDPESLISQLTVSQANEMISDKRAAKGMIPKLDACIAAVQSGVGRAHLIDGRQPHSLLIEIFTDAGLGTMVVPDERKRPAMSAHLLGGFV